MNLQLTLDGQHATTGDLTTLTLDFTDESDLVSIGVANIARQTKAEFGGLAHRCDIIALIDFLKFVLDRTSGDDQ